VGDYVKVEGDRGEDLGVVVQKCPVYAASAVPLCTAGYRGRGFAAGSSTERKMIYRRATEEEYIALMEKFDEEDAVLQVRDTTH
jgi:hypothetical protein